MQDEEFEHSTLAGGRSNVIVVSRCMFVTNPERTTPFWVFPSEDAESNLPMPPEIGVHSAGR